MEQPRPDTLSTALAGAAQVLATNPALAERQARAILKAVPAQQQALMLLVSARRTQGDTAGARAILELEAKAQPKLAAIQFELGLLLGELGEHDSAIAALSRVTELEPDHPGAWRALGDALAEMGRVAEAAQAYARQFRSSVKDLEFLEEAANMGEDKLPMAEALIGAFLEIHPTDVAATHMMAQVYMRSGRAAEAEEFLSRAVQSAPTVAALRYEYASALFRQKKWEEADRQLDMVLAQEPDHLAGRAMKSVTLRQLGDYEQALVLYDGVLRDDPGNPKAWLSYGHTLATVGRRNDAVAAYRRSIELEPNLGEAWWSLADLKTFRFASEDVETMKSLLERAELGDDDRCQLHFALGKALEDLRDHAGSFEHYRGGNLIRRASLPFDSRALGESVRRAMALFTPEFFYARKNFGCPSPDAIFIVGLRRSGSTLIEQILSSHSAIEGTLELPDLPLIAGELDDRGWNGRESGYPEILAALGSAELRSLGEKYLERTKVQRKLAKPHFIDKMPTNFEHIGLIHLMLPNAKIIDARRHPLACGFSNFKQHFAGGVAHSYDLADIGRYYREYVELMAHFDRVLPGRVHRVFYESLVRDPETEIRRLLAYCGVPFEEACLRFYESGRGVRTVSSEQVRQPIYSEALEQWRNYEAWLGPLKSALGPVLESYPAVPDFQSQPV